MSSFMNFCTLTIIRSSYSFLFMISLSCNFTWEFSSFKRVFTHRCRLSKNKDFLVIQVLPIILNRQNYF